MNILLAVIFMAATGCAEMSEIKKFKAEQRAIADAYDAATPAREAARQSAAQREREEQAYREWYKTLTADQQMAERQRKEAQREREQARQDAMMMQMLNLSSQNMNAAMDRMQNSFKLTPPAPYTPMHSINEGMLPPRQRTNCVSNVVGNQVYTNCY